MRRVFGSIRTGALYYPKGASRLMQPSVRAAGGAAALAVLSILFCLIFYQNLPGTLDGMASKDLAMSANMQDRIVKLCMMAVSFYVIASRWSVARLVARNVIRGAIALLLLVPLSALWSIEPTITLLRFSSLACGVLVCFAIVLVGWDRQRLQQLAVPPVMFVLLASLVAGIIYPDRITEIGTDISQRGAWHGIANSKNQFGMMASVGVILCFNGWLAWGRRKYWYAAGTVVALVCLILSRSNTSQLATMVGALSMVLVMRVPVIRQRYSAHVVIAIAAALIVYQLVIQDLIPGANVLLAPITRLFGKDTTFSARTIIWRVIKEHIQAAPYLGTGYGAYWIGVEPRSPSYIFISLMYFYPTEAHNGYLDVVNDLGFMGLICLLAFLVGFIRQALQLMRFDRRQAALYLGLLFQQMLMNMSESEWLSRTGTFTVLVLAVICMSRGLLEHRRQAEIATVAGG